MSEAEPTEAMIAAGASVLEGCGLVRWNAGDSAIRELAYDVFQAMIRLSDRPEISDVMTLTDVDLADLARTAAALIDARSPSLCAALMLFPSGEDGERSQGCSVVVNPARSAIGNVLLRIDDHLHNSVAARLHFRNALVSRLNQIVEGFGKFSARDEPPHSFVILAAKSKQDWRRQVRERYPPATFLEAPLAWIGLWMTGQWPGNEAKLSYPLSPRAPRQSHQRHGVA